MDINVSPDLEAYYCYALVLLLGLATAWVQVSKRLGNLPGKWIMVNTWSLFFAFTVIPVGLFWLLDRTNATHDTSLFAAVIVGVGYQQILSGSIASVRAPGEVSKLWQPFSAWADTIAIRIRDRVAINTSQFDEKLLTTIVKDPQKLEALKLVVFVHAGDPRSLSKTLDSISADADILGSAGVKTKQAATLYMALKQASPQQFEFLLYKSQVIPPQWYFWYAKEWRSKITATVVALAIVCAAFEGGLELWQPKYRASYFVWRLRKENGSDNDHYRARVKLSGYLASSPEVYSQLTDLLRVPTLPVKTADAILSLLVETRNLAAKEKVDLRGQLVESLRTENSDVRGRIQKVLVYLAKEEGAGVSPDLQAWQPDPKNTADDIDAIVKQWRQVAR